MDVMEIQGCFVYRDVHGEGLAVVFALGRFSVNAMDGLCV